MTLPDTSSSSSTNNTSTDAPKYEISSDSSDTDDKIQSFEIEFTPIDTTKRLIEAMRERWWNFFGATILTKRNAIGNDHTTQDLSDSGIGSGGMFPLFTGWRVPLGGDDT